MTIPLDDVEAVCLQHTGRWAVRVSGCLEFLEEEIGNGNFKLAYVPPTIFVVSPVSRAVDKLSERVKGIAEAVAGTVVVEHHPPPRTAERVAAPSRSGAV